MPFLKEPLVSIVIPVFNGSNFLGQAIESALAQTYKNTEILVVNDGSSDGGATARVGRQFGDRVRYFEKPNGGVASALNFGLQKMNGELFSWLSHDDLYHPRKLEIQVQSYLKYPTSTVIFSDFDFINSDGVVIESVVLRDIDVKRQRFHLLSDCTLHGCTLLIPKSLFDRVGFFNEDLRYVQDYDMWLRLSCFADFKRAPGALVQGRQHAQQDTRSKVGQVAKECDLYFATWVKRFAKEHHGNSVERFRDFFQLYRSYKNRGFKTSARKSLKMAIRYGSEPRSLVWLFRRALGPVGS